MRSRLQKGAQMQPLPSIIASEGLSRQSRNQRGDSLFLRSFHAATKSSARCNPLIGSRPARSTLYQPANTVSRHHQGAIDMRRRDRARAVHVFDQMLEFFGEDGAHWLQGRMRDAQGRRCLYGALDHLCHKRRVLHIAVEDLLAAAIPAKPHCAILPWYNDRARSFADVRALILKARALAVADLDQPQPQKRAA
jgi:hypothetical protein